MCFKIIDSEITASVRSIPVLFKMKVIIIIIRYPETRPKISPNKRFVKLRSGNFEIIFKSLNKREMTSNNIRK